MTVEKYLSVMDNEEAYIRYDGMDEAIVGVASIATEAGPRKALLYDYAMMAAILVRRDQSTLTDAFEWLDLNVLNSYAGEYSPVLVNADLEDGLPFNPYL